MRCGHARKDKRTKHQEVGRDPHRCAYPSTSVGGSEALAAANVACVTRGVKVISIDNGISE